MYSIKPINRVRIRNTLLIWIHCLAFSAALIFEKDPLPKTLSTTIEWPVEFNGQALTPLPLSAKERNFITGFPGDIARFSDGQRELLVRYIERPSRRIHPSADCLRGTGFSIENQPLRRDITNQLWGCVVARRQLQSYKVCERIYDPEGNSWYDVSSWFWAATLKQTAGPWWAITLAEKLTPS